MTQPSAPRALPDKPKRSRQCGARRNALEEYAEEVWREMEEERAERIAAGWTPPPPLTSTLPHGYWGGHHHDAADSAEGIVREPEVVYEMVWGLVYIGLPPPLAGEPSTPKIIAFYGLPEVSYKGWLGDLDSNQD